MKSIAGQESENMVDDLIIALKATLQCAQIIRQRFDIAKREIKKVNSVFT
jgi:hypothetical protein